MRLLSNSFTNKVRGLQSTDRRFTENKVFHKDIFQQTLAGLLDVLKASSM